MRGRWAHGWCHVMKKLDCSLLGFVSCIESLYPPSRCLVITSLRHPVHQRRHLYFTREMADRPQSPRFQTLLESALEVYGKMTGIKLAQHPLFMELQNCNPVGSITAFLQSQAPAFSDFTENDRLMGPIKVTVWILTTLSATASLDDTFDPVRQKALMVFHISDHFPQTLSPVNAIYTGLAMLLAVCPVLSFA